MRSWQVHSQLAHDYVQAVRRALKADDMNNAPGVPDSIPSNVRDLLEALADAIDALNEKDMP